MTSVCISGNIPDRIGCEKRLPGGFGNHHPQKKLHPLRRLQRMEFVDLPDVSLRDPCQQPCIPSHIGAAMTSHRPFTLGKPDRRPVAGVQVPQASRQITNSARLIVDAIG